MGEKEGEKEKKNNKKIIQEKVCLKQRVPKVTREGWDGVYWKVQRTGRIGEKKNCAGVYSVQLRGHSSTALRTEMVGGGSAALVAAG